MPPTELDDERPPKRQRVSRACAPCRYAKLRCNGQQPVCATCRQQRKNCVYETGAKRRGLRSGYVRALELLWGLTLQEIEHAEPTVNNLLGRLSRQDLVASLDRGELNTAAAAVLDRWKQSSILRRLDDLLDENDEENDEAVAGGVPDESQNLRPDHPPGWVIVRYQRDQSEPTSSNVVRPNVNVEVNMSSLESCYASQGSHPPERWPPAYAFQLLVLFLGHGQSWLPILERHTLLRTSFSFQRKLPSIKHGDRAVLWGVYAYASATCGHLLNAAEESRQAKECCNEFRTQAYSMLPLDSNLPVEMGHVQCAILISLTRLGSGAVRASWRLVRMAIQMMREMPRQYGYTVNQDTLAKAWLACFLLDTLTSACLHSQPLLHFCDVANWCHIDESGTEEWQPWCPPTTTNYGPPLDLPTHSLSMLLLQVKLMRILNDYLHNKSTTTEKSRNDLIDWNQELLSCLSRERLTSILQREDLEILQLPPSFTNLSIIYTGVWKRIMKQPQDPRCTPSLSGCEPTYPLLSHTNLQKLQQDQTAYSRLPALQLLTWDGPVSGLNNRPDNAVVVSEPALELPEDVNLVIASLDPPRTIPEPNSSLAMDMAEPMLPEVSDISTQAREPFTSFDAVSNPNRMVDAEQGSGSEFPSFDCYMDSTDAPFLEYLDTLDERPIHDRDLFNKSLGFSF